MSLILNIDCSSENAFISIAENGIRMGSQNNAEQKDHAAFLQTGIQELFSEHQLRPDQLDAVAVSAGPGSYTGLRVGMASAKGLCYALGIPFIALDSLLIAAASAKEQISDDTGLKNHLFCPMIDARRQEVFTAIYNSGMDTYMKAKAMILDEHAFENELASNHILFFGSGMKKWKSVCIHRNAAFLDLKNLQDSINQLSYTAFSQGRFTELADSQPFYLKDFHTGR